MDNLVTISLPGYAWVIIDAITIGVCLFTVTAFMSHLNWLFELTSHFRVQYFALLTLLTLVYLFGGRANLGILTVVFAFVNFLIIAPLYLALPRPRPARLCYRLLVANVLQGNQNFEGLIRLVEWHRPDLVVLAEVNQVWLDNLAILKERYAFTFAEPREDHFGLALFSLLPFIRAETLYFTAPQVPAITAEFQLDGKSLTLIGVHAPPPRGKARAALRNQQLEKIAGYVCQQPGEIILCGDFNITSWSAHFQQLIHKTGLRDSRVGYGIQPSWPVDRPFLFIPIDHVLATPGITIHNRHTGSAIGSDHLPVLVDFSVK